MTYSKTWPLGVYIPGSRDADEIDDALNTDILPGLAERLADVVEDVTADPWVPKVWSRNKILWIPWWLGRIYTGVANTSSLNSVYPSTVGGDLSIAVPLPLPVGSVIKKVFALMENSMTTSTALADLRVEDASGGMSAFTTIATATAVLGSGPAVAESLGINYTLGDTSFAWMDVRLHTDLTGSGIAALYSVGVEYRDG